MIEMRIESVRVSLMSPNQVVILKELDGERRLPIFIGKAEGDAIAFRLNNDVVIPRPLTHDLAANVLSALDAKVTQIVINDLRSQHFVAAIHVQLNGTEVVLDVRPSDALAIAVRVDCPIFAQPHVLDEAGVFLPVDRNDAELGTGNVGALYARADMMRTPFVGDSFDHITAVSVIEHGFDCERLFAEAARILKRGGTFLASFDYWPTKIDTSQTPLFGLPWNIFSADEVKQLIDGARRAGLVLTGPINLEVGAPPIHFERRRYTFGVLEVRKES